MPAARPDPAQYLSPQRPRLRHRRPGPEALATRAFFYLPFEHSETLADQERSLALFEALGIEHYRRYAEAHLEVIARFGRFPHRNRALGRINTPEEQAWLDAGGGF